MVERFFFNGIDAEPGRSAVAGQHDAVIAGLTNETEPSLAVAEFAETGTQIALYATQVNGVPPLTWDDAGFEYCSFRHEDAFPVFSYIRKEAHP
ncbi:uncharacterized protein METZ01_LOCUS261836, partial [marine metagenome]